MADRKELLAVCRRIRGKDLREKYSNFYGKKVGYFSGKSFLRVILQSHAELKLPFEIKYKKDAIHLGDRYCLLSLLEHKLLSKVSKVPDPNDPKITRALVPVAPQTMTEDGHYVWSAEVQSRIWSHFASFLLVLAVIGVCCFSVWPLSVKLAVWYVSVYLLAAIAALSVLRLILYVLLFIFGYSFWLFPNLFDDKVTPT